MTSEQLVNLAAILKAKPTTIDLERDKRKQKDRMITKYVPRDDAGKDAMRLDMHKLVDMGFSVERAKLERELRNLNWFPSDAAYVEVHVKVQGESGMNYPGTVRSKNPTESGTRFINARMYSEKDMVVFRETFKHIKGFEDIIKTQIEAVLVDTNHKHDSWWA